MGGSSGTGSLPVSAGASGIRRGGGDFYDGLGFQKKWILYALSTILKDGT